MGGKLHIAPLVETTPTKDRPEAAPATPEAVKVEPQLAGGESWGDGLEPIKANNIGRVFVARAGALPSDGGGSCRSGRKTFIESLLWTNWIDRGPAPSG